MRFQVCKISTSSTKLLQLGKLPVGKWFQVRRSRDLPSGLYRIRRPSILVLFWATICWDYNDVRLCDGNGSHCFNADSATWWRIWPRALVFHHWHGHILSSYWYSHRLQNQRTRLAAEMEVVRYLWLSCLGSCIYFLLQDIPTSLMLSTCTTFY